MVWPTLTLQPEVVLPTLHHQPESEPKPSANPRCRILCVGILTSLPVCSLPSRWQEGGLLEQEGHQLRQLQLLATEGLTFCDGLWYVLHLVFIVECLP